MKKMSKLEALTLTDEALDKVVKIQGTKYDRKRKVSPELGAQMSKLLRRGKTDIELAEKFNVSLWSVRYNTDPEFRARQIAMRSGKHTGKDHITIKNRVAYKRTLVAEGKLTAVA